MAPEAGGGYAQAQAVPQQMQVMTVEGTINKTLILFALLLAGAAFTWTALFTGGAALALPLALGGFFGAFIVGLVTCFRPKSAPITAPIYAVLEGLFLGAISAIFQEMYHGIVVQAVALTMGVFGIMLTVYRTGLIKVTEQLKMGVVAATGAIALTYLLSFIMRAFGNPAISGFLWSNNPLNIGLSLVIVGVAAFNLLLDFDLVEKGVARRAPKFMEWYASYGLMVTLVWLYLELLRLLANLNRR
ncbi:MAG: Bax inhibitor-1/YccA family protein [Fibrella sp.]|nr:Bax inhibitor-1/YccA family protein [Armatimonadota bacterium]